MQCRSCGFDNPPSMRFCGGCGTPLPEAASPPPVASVPPAEDAERRQLTLLFSDLVGSTSLSERLDPEDLRELMRRYQARVVAAVEERGGWVVQYLGDGILAYFGYPQALEDAPRQAVRAALAAASAVGELSEETARRLGVEVAVRVGVHTGVVVVGTVGAGGTRERLALGAAPNLAARIQGMAPPGGVVVSEATRRLLGRGFELEPLGERELSGFSRPVALFRVEREREGPRRAAAVLPLVDRELERAELERFYAEAEGGRGSTVLLVGEAGVGKSRLARAFVEQLPRDHRWIEAACSPHHRGSALYPLTQALAHDLGIEAEDPARVRLDKLSRGVERAGLAPDAVALFAALLALPVPADRVGPPLSAQRARRRTLELLVAWVLSLAARRPATLWLEDVQWSDPSSLEWLELLVPRLGSTPLLVVLTARSGFSPPWPGAVVLPVERLEPEHQARLVRSVAGETALDEETVDRLVERSDGIPLYAEEIARMLVDEEAAGRPTEIPATLQDSLLARLDRLGPAKRIAQWAATVGREVDPELLAAAADLPHEELHSGVDRLLDSGILEPAGLGGTVGEPRLRFRHALLQEAAYSTLLKKHRRRQHRAVARALETESFADRAQAAPELVARHWTEAGALERAVPWWLAAGRRALARSAHREAVLHLTSGLELVLEVRGRLESGGGAARSAAGSTVPVDGKDGPSAEWLTVAELDLRMAMGPALLAGRGYAAPEVAETFSRARELCRDLVAGEGSLPVERLFPALRGILPYYLVRARLEEAAQLGRELLELAQGVAAAAAARRERDPGADGKAGGEREAEAAAALDPPALLLEAHLSLATVRFWQGRVDAALDHAERALGLYDPDRHARSTTVAYGQDSGVLARLYAGWCRYWLGDAAAAREEVSTAVAEARRLAHPHTLAMALDHASSLYQYLLDPEGARSLVEESRRLAEEQEFAMWMAMARFRASWIAGSEGDPEAADRMAESIAAFRRTGALLARPLHLAHLAEAYRRAGRTAEGLAAVEEGLAAVEEHGERHHEPELYRLHGELSTLVGEAETATESLERAWELARERGSRTLALRAAVSLARHRSAGEAGEEGGGTAARRLLDEALEPFAGAASEGFPDLAAARRLAARLGSEPGEAGGVSGAAEATRRGGEPVP